MIQDINEKCVSIHATLAGGDLIRFYLFFVEEMFLSTPPSRVATTSPIRTSANRVSFYPRHPRGWRLADWICHFPKEVFLSTPPSRVATLTNFKSSPLPELFLSTPPSRVATASHGVVLPIL